MLKRLGVEAAGLLKHMFHFALTLVVAGALYGVTQNATVSAVAAIVLLWVLEVVVKHRATRRKT
jgi:branched-subunit amino acid transport protein